MTDARLSVPWLIRSTLRWIVSPGAIAVASTVKRFVEAPAAPSATVTVPDDTVCEAEVELVKVANVPSPAMLAAAPRMAAVARSFRPRERDRGRPAFRSEVRGARQSIRLFRSAAAFIGR